MLPLFQRPIVDGMGNLMPFSQVVVTRESDGLAQTLYLDALAVAEAGAGGVIQVGASGYASFYLPPNFYKMVVSGNGVTFTLRNVPVHESLLVIDETTTARTSSILDIGNLILWNNAADSEYTLIDSTMFKNQQVHFRQYGAGKILIAPETGITVQPPAGGTLQTNDQGATVTLKKVTDDGEYILIGHTVAA